MFHKQLTKLRKEYNLTQEELANKLGVSRSTYAQYEFGRRHPDFSLLEKIADLFGVSIDFLFGRVERREVTVTEAEKELLNKISLDDRTSNFKLVVDGKPLTAEEQKMIVAFIRTIRGFDK
jgi:transcriptional regulator with XRE-family HTH domain